MHVATTTRRYKGKVYETHLLRRSVREGDKVRKETLANLSHLAPDVIDVIRRSLKGETFVSADDTFEIRRSLPHGHVAAVAAMAKTLGLPKLLGPPCDGAGGGSGVPARLEAGYDPVVGRHHPGRGPRHW